MPLSFRPDTSLSVGLQTGLSPHVRNALASAMEEGSCLCDEPGEDPEGRPDTHISPSLPVTRHESPLLNSWIFFLVNQEETLEITCVSQGLTRLVEATFRLDKRGNVGGSTEISTSRSHWHPRDRGKSGGASGAGSGPPHGARAAVIWSRSQDGSQAMEEERLLPELQGGREGRDDTLGQPLTPSLPSSLPPEPFVVPLAEPSQHPADGEPGSCSLCGLAPAGTEQSKVRCGMIYKKAGPQKSHQLTQSACFPSKATVAQKCWGSPNI